MEVGFQINEQNAQVEERKKILRSTGCTRVSTDEGLNFRRSIGRTRDGKSAVKVTNGARGAVEVWRRKWRDEFKGVTKIK